MRRDVSLVALLIDYDNLEIGASYDLPGRPLDLGCVIELAQRYGTVIVARAYADWGDPGERLAVYEAGIEPCFAPIFRTTAGEPGKSLADTVLVADGVDLLWRVSPDYLVLVTSDKDYLPLARLARLRGTRTILVGSDRTAVPLRRLADEYVSYRDLVRGTGVPVATHQRAGLVPLSRGPLSASQPESRGPRLVAETRPAEGLRRGAAPRQVEARVTLPSRDADLASTAIEPRLPEAAALGETPLDAGRAGAETAAAGTRRRRRRRGGRSSGAAGAGEAGGALDDALLEGDEAAADDDEGELTVAEESLVQATISLPEAPPALEPPGLPAPVEPAPPPAPTPALVRIAQPRRRGGAQDAAARAATPPPSAPPAFEPPAFEPPAFEPPPLADPSAPTGAPPLLEPPPTAGERTPFVPPPAIVQRASTAFGSFGSFDAPAPPAVPEPAPEPAAETEVAPPALDAMVLDSPLPPLAGSPAVDAQDADIVLPPPAEPPEATTAAAPEAPLTVLTAPATESGNGVEDEPPVAAEEPPSPRRRRRSTGGRGRGAAANAETAVTGGDTTPT